MKSRKIMTHKGGIHLDSIDDFASLPDPEPLGPRHKPIRHDWSLNEVKEGLVPHGWEIEWEEYVLHQDKKKNKDNAFALFGIRSTEMQGEDYQRIVGARNSNTYDFSFEVGAGQRVFVCDNMAFCAEFKVARKHTKNIMRDIPILMGEAMGDISHAFVAQDVRIDLYKHTFPSREKQDHIMMECVRRNALPPSQMNHWLKEIREPSHEEFSDGSAWSFQNGFTEIAKRWSIHDSQRRTKTLTGIMDRVLDIERLLPKKKAHEVVAAMEDAEVSGNIV